VLLPTESIREYYARIDANDTEWVLALFAPDAVYERAGTVFKGAEEVRHFFCVQRQIRGTHDVERIWLPEHNVVVAVGRFQGVGAEGDSRCVRFADIWWFGDCGRIERRETFLGMGHRYVQA
jgi:ketosteroid isomerase-like protein